MSEDGSLLRRLEIILGGPARPFPLTVRDADTLVQCVTSYIEEFQKGALSDGGDEMDVDVIDNLVEIRERLWQHAGYTSGYVKKNG